MLLHFFTTFSELSQKQLPQIKRLHENYNEHGLVVIGLTLEKNRGKVRKFARQNKLPYPILLDAGTIFKGYKLGQMPNLCFIGKDGVIADLYIGFTPCSEETTEPRIAELLNPTITGG